MPIDAACEAMLRRLRTPQKSHRLPPRWGTGLFWEARSLVLTAKERLCLGSRWFLALEDARVDADSCGDEALIKQRMSGLV